MPLKKNSTGNTLKGTGHQNDPQPSQFMYEGIPFIWGGELGIPGVLAPFFLYVGVNSLEP